jgi:hypothetical protein
MKTSVQRAAAWGALEFVAAREFCRDLLEPGSTPFGLHLHGLVADKSFDVEVGGTLVVSPPSETSTSHTPDPATLLAVVLERIGPRAREDLLASIPETFAAAGNSLTADAKLVAQCEQMLSRLRVKVPKTRRGAVSAAGYTVE